jgi:WD40 repeat protein
LAAQHDPDAAVREAAQYTLLRTHPTKAFPLIDTRAQQPIDGEMDNRPALSFQAAEWQAQRESENGLTNEHVVLESGQTKQIIVHIGGIKHMKEVMTPEQMPTRRFAPEEGRTTPARRTPRLKFTPLWRTLSICAAIVVVVVNIAAWGILTQLHHGQPGSRAGTATIQAGKRLYTYSFGKGKAMNDLAWSPDGKHMAAAIGEEAHGTVHIWDATTGGHEVIYTPSPGSNQHVDPAVYATSIAWSPDGKRLASAIGDVQVWDVATGRILTRYFPPLSSGLGTVNTIAWSPDGKYLAGVFASWNSNGICIWDTRTGKLVRMFQSNNEMPSRAWSPNGKYLLTIGSAVEVWSMPAGQLVSTHPQHYVLNAAWSPDSTRIASADGNGTVQIWDALTGHGLLTYKGHANQGTTVEAVAWSPDGKRLVSSGSDIQVWNATTGKLIFVYTGQHSSKGSPYLRPLAWSPNGKLIASGEQQPRDAGGNIQVWEAVSSNAA